MKDLSARISGIDESNLSQRLPELESKDGIGQLTNRFNHMLSRLEEAFIKQKRFTASAAHELKTPLATMKAGIQVLKRDSSSTLNDYQENANVKVAFDEPQPDLLQGMTCSVKFIQKRVEDVLTLANKAITLRDGRQYVTVLLPDGSHEEREIQTGFSDDRVSEITGGVDEGDVTVIAG